MGEECGSCDADELREQNELLSDRIEVLRAVSRRLRGEVATLLADVDAYSFVSMQRAREVERLRGLLDEALDLAEYEGIGCGGCENDRCRTCEPQRIRERARKAEGTP